MAAMTGVDLPAMLHLSLSSFLISSISSAFSLGTPRSHRGLAAALLAAAALPGMAIAQADAPTSPAALSTKTARESRLPPPVEAALARAKLPREAVSALVVEVDGRAAPRLDWQSHVAMNPASVMKLVTTYAALDQLGDEEIALIRKGAAISDRGAAAAVACAPSASHGWARSRCARRSTTIPIRA